MTDKTTSPHEELTAPATLVRGDGCYLWRVDSCPLCGGSHTHGGGSLDGDPYALLGHRAAHCHSTRGYVLQAGNDGAAR